MKLRTISTATATPELARIARLFGARLQRLPGSLGKHPGLLFCPGLEGYRDYTFGSRAGPSVQVRHLFHELGHAAQFGPALFRSRANANGFVFKMRKVFVLGRYYEEPSTCQATDRELDTFAHQLHIMQAAGVKCDTAAYVDYSASIMRHMPDWWAVPGDGGGERKRECAERILERYESLAQPEVLDKLAAWLDATYRRIKRKPARAYRPVELRFHTDGSLFTG